MRIPSSIGASLRSLLPALALGGAVACAVLIGTIELATASALPSPLARNVAPVLYYKAPVRGVDRANPYPTVQGTREDTFAPRARLTPTAPPPRAVDTPNPYPTMLAGGGAAPLASRDDDRLFASRMPALLGMTADQKPIRAPRAIDTENPFLLRF